MLGWANFLLKIGSRSVCMHTSVKVLSAFSSVFFVFFLKLIHMVKLSV